MQHVKQRKNLLIGVQVIYLVKEDELYCLETSEIFYLTSNWFAHFVISSPFISMHFRHVAWVNRCATIQTTRVWFFVEVYHSEPPISSRCLAKSVFHLSKVSKWVPDNMDNESQQMDTANSRVLERTGINGNIGMKRCNKKLRLGMQKNPRATACNLEILF